MAARFDRKERIVILVGIIILTLVCLVPPWQTPEGPGRWDSAGYWPVFLGAYGRSNRAHWEDRIGWVMDAQLGLERREDARVDTTRLLIQCAVVALATAGVVWFMRLWRKDQAAEKTT